MWRESRLVHPTDCPCRKCKPHIHNQKRWFPVTISSVENPKRSTPEAHHGIDAEEAEKLMESPRGDHIETNSTALPVSHAQEDGINSPINALTIKQNSHEKLAENFQRRNTVQLGFDRLVSESRDLNEKPEVGTQTNYSHSTPSTIFSSSVKDLIQEDKAPMLNKKIEYSADAAKWD